jgi:hypothetical protein
MDGQIIRQSSSYRHGLVLGLTMAEIMILLVFCLLIAMTAFLRTEKPKSGNAHQQIAAGEDNALSDHDLVNALRQNPSFYEGLRAAATGGGGSKVDEFWRDVTEGQSIANEFRQSGLTSAEIREKIATAYIPGSPHNPKFLWVDDAEIVRDRIAEVSPVPGNCFAYETKRRIGELGASCVAFVVRDVSVHEAPQPLDRIEMRAIGRDEMQLDPAPGPGEPFLHQLGVMVARVVKKDMDERQQRIERLDRFQEPDRRDGVNS